MVHCGILAIVFSFGSELFETLANHFREELFSLDKRNLHVAVGVAVESELTGHACRERLVGLGICFAELTEHPFALLFRINCSEFLSLDSEKVVEFGDEGLDSGDEFD